MSSCTGPNIFAWFWSNLEFLNSYSYKSPGSNLMQICPLGTSLVNEWHSWLKLQKIFSTLVGNIASCSGSHYKYHIDIKPRNESANVSTIQIAVGGMLLWIYCPHQWTSIRYKLRIKNKLPHCFVLLTTNVLEKMVGVPCNFLWSNFIVFYIVYSCNSMLWKGLYYEATQNMYMDIFEICDLYFKKKCDIQKVISPCCHNSATFRSNEETRVGLHTSVDLWNTE
jgi:hypothetical protein